MLCMVSETVTVGVRLRESVRGRLSPSVAQARTGQPSIYRGVGEDWGRLDGVNVCGACPAAHTKPTFSAQLFQPWSGQNVINLRLELFKNNLL